MTMRKRNPSAKAGASMQARGHKRSHKGAVKAQEEEQWLEPEARDSQEQAPPTVQAPVWPSNLPAAVHGTTVYRASSEAASRRHKKVFDCEDGLRLLSIT